MITSGNVIVLCVTGAREASAFRLRDLAAAVGLTTEQFKSDIHENEDLFARAVCHADPLQRIEAPRGGDEEGCLHNLRLIYPDAVESSALLS